jgi:hypothetical protein
MYVQFYLNPKMGYTVYSIHYIPFFLFVVVVLLHSIVIADRRYRHHPRRRCRCRCPMFSRLLCHQSFLPFSCIANQEYSQAKRI